MTWCDEIKIELSLFEGPLTERLSLQVQVALAVSKMKEFTGRNEPTVIT